jgi:hypothetical protein
MFQLIAQIISALIFYSLLGLLVFLVWRWGRNSERLTQILIDAVRTSVDSVRVTAEANRKLVEHITGRKQDE